jgi:LCP family protein required for cell wall assembly
MVRRRQGGERQTGRSTSNPGAGEPLAGRHFRARRGAPLWLKIGASAVALILVAAVAVVGVLFTRLQGNVQVADLNLGTNPETQTAVSDSNDPLQILIMGTDTRDGTNGEYGSTDDSSGFGNSDVMMLMNLSADNKRVSVVSFPRDLMTSLPSCRNSETDETFDAMPFAQLNSALKLGGPGCTVAAINDLTGLHIDHFMLADFNAVKDLSNTLGGVEVCVDHAMRDPDSGLELPAGTSKVQGEQALSFLRTRHGFGDASDLARIKAQQAFLASMTQKIKGEGTLTDLPKVYGIADAVTRNLTIDKGLANIGSMISVANRLKNVDLAKVAFITAPWAPDPSDEARVVLLQPDADNLFAALRADQDLTPAPAAPTETATAPATEPAAPPAAYDRALQPITVTDATGQQTRSAELAAVLAGAGFTSLTQNAAPPAPTTQVLYGPNFQDVATDVAAQFGIPAAQIAPSPSVTGVQLVIGSDFASGTAFGAAPLPENIVSATADQQVQCQSVNPLYYQ